MPLHSTSTYDDILECYKKGDWETILTMQFGLDDSYFLWPTPSKTDLHFITRTIRGLGLNKIVSIGCGTGLLEWLLKITTGVDIIGVEIDKEYWTSKYARGVFIDIIFPENKAFSNTVRDKNAALMFCYFNNFDAFHSYLDNYEGHCLVIIGPHENGRHADPKPFDSKIPNCWSLLASQGLAWTGDHIAIYTRNKQL